MKPSASGTMKPSASGKTVGGFSVAAYAKSAKESAKRVAEENGITSGGKLWETMKAKAHSLTSQVQGTVRATSTRRSSGARRAKSAGPISSTAKDADEELVTQICDIFELRVSPVAARLALSKVKGGTKLQKIQVACDWLCDEKNVAEVEAAENADIERSSSEELASQGKSLEDKDSPRKACPEPVREGRRRDSGSFDDGRGLGFFMRRRSLSSPQKPSQPSPRKVPMPGRLSRGRVSTGSVDSGVGDDRPSLARRVSMGSQTSAGSEAEPDHSEAGCQAEEAASHAQVAACEDVQLKDVENPETDEEEDDEDDEEEDAPLLRPPVVACWDWPLSKNEKKSRVQQIEQQINFMDHKKLKQERDGLRAHLRKMSTGGAHASRPSRLSM